MGTYAVRNVVLVHGGFVDGSGWQGVYESLSRDGFRVSIVQNPTLSLQGDVEATRQIIDAQDGPVVLVGHSYGGAVITEAGTHPAHGETHLRSSFLFVCVDRQQASRPAG